MNGAQALRYFRTLCPASGRRGTGDGAQTAPPPASPVSLASRHNTLYLARKAVCQGDAPWPPLRPKWVYLNWTRLRRHKIGGGKSVWIWIAKPHQDRRERTAFAAIFFCLQGGRGEAFLTFGGQGSRRWALFAGLNDLALRNQLVIMRCSRLTLQRREKDSRSKLQRTPLGT